MQSHPFPLAILAICLSLGTHAQDRFPERIPPSPVQAYLLDVATLPDYANNQPARMSVLTTDSAGRIFVNDQRGPLYLVTFTNGIAETVTTYLDLRDEDVSLRTSSGEQGFQGFDFHPDFHDPGKPGYGKLYTIHSSHDDSRPADFTPGGGGDSFDTLLLEWTTDQPGADTFIPANPLARFREILRFEQPYGNHNAGHVAFDPTATGAERGLLWFMLGDGGSGGDPLELAEDPSNPYGAILRIDPLGTNAVSGRYGIATQNVFAVDGDNSTLAEIYAYGLRNPQRFGWDPETGALFIADIGQNNVEEINVGANGAHYGWDLREGSFAFESSNTNGLTGPAFEYDHLNMVTNPPTGIGNRAVTVGEVARNSGIPGLDGHVLFGDFPTGLMLALDVDSAPLDGGQDGITELWPLDADGTPTRLLDRINAARQARGLSTTSRADLRYGVDTPGMIFVLNKRDGILRRLFPVPSVRTDAPDARLHFTGTLQGADTLGGANAFTKLVPQPTSPVDLTTLPTPFLRARIP